MKEALYRLAEERWAQVDKDDLNEIKKYNRWMKMIRKLLEEEDE